MRRLGRVDNEKGVALVAVLLVTLAVLALAIGATAIGGSSSLIAAYEEQQSVLEATADAGLEEMRAVLTEDVDHLPATGYVRLENRVPVVDAAASVIPGLARTSYAGYVSDADGRDGVKGAVVSVVEDQRGDRVIRRRDLYQESFARFAYFTDDEGPIIFGGGDVIDGPAHSNDDITIHRTGATFKGEVTTAQSFKGAEFATFLKGSREKAKKIEMPSGADLDRLRALAGRSAMALDLADATRFFQGGTPMRPTVAIEFVVEWFNFDNSSPDRESPVGFMKVYTSSDASFVVGAAPATWTGSNNCGHVHPDGRFIAVGSHSGTDHDAASVLGQQATRCYPGGHEMLQRATSDVIRPPGQRFATWPGWNNNAAGLAQVANTLNITQNEARQLFPLHRRFNPDFLDVIHVNGNVAVSGTFRGRATLAVNGSILIVDDLRYNTDPSAPGALGENGDMLGLFSSGNITIADNSVNSPQQSLGPAQAWRSYDETWEEHVHAVILTLSSFAAENHGTGPNRVESCGETRWGRGCLAVHGGIIQKVRGAVGTSGGTGYLKQYKYDSRAATDPPPYFPTTGRWLPGRFYEVDPTGFEIEDYWEDIASPGLGGG